MAWLDGPVRSALSRNPSKTCSTRRCRRSVGTSAARAAASTTDSMPRDSRPLAKFFPLQIQPAGIHCPRGSSRPKGYSTPSAAGKAIQARAGRSRGTSLGTPSGTPGGPRFHSPKPTRQYPHCAIMTSEGFLPPSANGARKSPKECNVRAGRGICLSRVVRSWLSSNRASSNNSAFAPS
jgi:hypothetical protein